MSIGTRDEHFDGRIDERLAASAAHEMPRSKGDVRAVVSEVVVGWQRSSWNIRNQAEPLLGVSEFAGHRFLDDGIQDIHDRGNTRNDAFCEMDEKFGVFSRIQSLEEATRLLSCGSSSSRTRFVRMLPRCSMRLTKSRDRINCIRVKSSRKSWTRQMALP